MPTDNQSSTPSPAQVQRDNPSLATQGKPSQTQSTTPAKQGSEPAFDATKYHQDNPSLATQGTPGSDEGPPQGDYQLNIPEGYEVTPEIKGKVDGLFRDAGLSNEKAQKFVDFYEEQTKEAAAAPYKIWSDTQAAWAKEVKEDPKIGGSNLPRTLGTIAKYIDSMPNAKEFREALTYTGAGNNPAIIRGLHALATHHVESGLATGRPSVNTGGPKAPGAKAMYPTLRSVHEG